MVPSIDRALAEPKFGLGESSNPLKDPLSHPTRADGLRCPQVRAPSAGLLNGHGRHLARSTMLTGPPQVVPLEIEELNCWVRRCPIPSISGRFIIEPSQPDCGWHHF